MGIEKKKAHVTDGLLLQGWVGRGFYQKTSLNLIYLISFHHGNQHTYSFAPTDFSFIDKREETRIHRDGVSRSVIYDICQAKAPAGNIPFFFFVLLSADCTFFFLFLLCLLSSGSCSFYSFARLPEIREFQSLSGLSSFSLFFYVTSRFKDSILKEKKMMGVCVRERDLCELWECGTFGMHYLRDSKSNFLNGQISLYYLAT
ncbi:hypothetical protein V8C35DRAFT_46293 [Trichoderma chlorosporum]